jgi:hypothetical protein
MATADLFRSMRQAKGVMSDKGLDETLPCPGCGVAIGEHTITGYRECLQGAGFDYELPHEDIPGGPLQFPGLEGHLAGEVTVASAFIDSALGRIPALRFIFTGSGAAPMSRVSLPPITLVMDAKGLKSFRTLVGMSIGRAILAARRGR